MHDAERLFVFLGCTENMAFVPIRMMRSCPDLPLAGTSLEKVA